MPMPPIPLVIDTDTGTDVDDVFALVLALASPEVDVIGVTVVDGDVDLRGRMVTRLLGIAGRADIPVFIGRKHPVGPGRMPTMRGHEGRGLLDVPYTGPEAVIHATPAPEWLVAESRRRSFHLAAIGPYTNVAAAIQLDPDLPNRLQHLTVMGGMVHQEHFSPEWRQFFDHIGESGAWIDHNTASDPTAALCVATSGVPMTWVTAELTFHLPLTPSGLDRIATAGGPLGDALVRMTRIWDDEWFRYLPVPYEGLWPFPANAAACLHDPLAVASIFAGEWLTLRAEPLRYEIDGEVFRSIATDNEAADATALVSVAADPVGFERFFLDRVVALIERVAVEGNGA